MGIALIKLKIMPESPATDLNEIEKNAERILRDNNAKGVRFEQRPIAFGLIAVIASFNIDESEELESIENALSEIHEVQSVQVEDMRRAFG